MHKPYQQIANGLLRSTPFDEATAPPNQLRWNPVPIPEQATDFLSGLITLAATEILRRTAVLPFTCTPRTAAWKGSTVTTQTASCCWCRSWGAC